MTVAPTKNLTDRAGPAASSDSPFPGWEAFIPQFVHPVKVAAVEALLWIGEPLSATQFAKLFSGKGERFREPNVRYHVRSLVKVGVLEVVPPDPFGDGGRKEKLVYFADPRAHQGAQDAACPRD